jgi:hypothetical protein
MKDKTFSILPYIVGAVLGAGGTVGIRAMAADPGDVIYESGGEQVCITTASAACYANCAVSDGTWPGAASDLLRVEIYRQEGCDVDKDFAATARGLAYADPSDVPPKSVYYGVVE